VENPRSIKKHHPGGQEASPEENRDSARGILRAPRQRNFRIGKGGGGEGEHEPREGYQSFYELRVEAKQLNGDLGGGGSIPQVLNSKECLESRSETSRSHERKETAFIRRIGSENRSVGTYHD